MVWLRHVSTLDQSPGTWLFDAVTGSTQRPPRLQTLALLAVVSAGLGLASSAAAETQGPKQQAQQLVAELETKTEQRALIDDALKRARSALNRAVEARRLKQLEQASVLERIALSWAQLGKLLLNTVALEAEATQLETSQNDMDTRIKRARALLEETLARRARAQETLKKLEQGPAPATTAPATPAPTTPAPATPAAAGKAKP
jgi:hypothetical protein